ncbi:unnamed protein product [Caenorhabditis auriculariae]|uniref:Uncharacterized protein n=1 Tax=Caenorhabditis auriculariae TaxID=2777116 RepID=A0A8S1HPX1_9PELO|nr:unnamed protein product [Caenorhabditis auriculariae]
MVLECGRPSFSLASKEKEKYKYPCRDGDYPPPAKTYSKRLLHEKEPDSDKVPRSRERQGASNSRCLRATCSRRAKDLTSMFVGMAVKVVLEGCGQLPRILIHRSGFNDEKLAKRPLRPPSPKLSGTRTCRGFMAPNFNVIETSDCYRNLLNDYTTAVGLQEKEHRSKLGVRTPKDFTAFGMSYTLSSVEKWADSFSCSKHDQCHRLELHTSRRIPKGSAGCVMQILI